MLNFLLNVLMTVLLSYYVMSALQWYSYRVERVIFNYKKKIWHLFYFILPYIFYEAFFMLDLVYVQILVLIIYAAALFLWNQKLDKKLVFTKRVKQTFIIIISFTIILNLTYFFTSRVNASILFPIILALFAIQKFEDFKLKNFELQAIQKLLQMKDLKIILITASYGKTSIKNYIYDILKDEFNCYKTPRSVNTKVGIIKDINENLSLNSQIYIAEAGARQNGDILEITKLLNPQIVVIGEIGSQHIEYFKTLENIRKTKLEILNSNRLEMVFAHSSTELEDSQKVIIYDKLVESIRADLEQTSFEIKIDTKKQSFASQLLGEFSAYNLAVCILVANYLKIDLEIIRKKVVNIKSVEHRLSVIRANGKLIIDDSFNGNFSGMAQSYKLAKNYDGRKVLITPGMVESSQSENEELAKIIDDIFDVVIITSELNLETFKKSINNEKIVVQVDKQKMQEVLKEHTKSGDLILFSNDAPSYI